MGGRKTLRAGGGFDLGWCPSCTARRAAETGLHLATVLPRVSHRQWTLSLPFSVRLAPTVGITRRARMGELKEMMSRDLALRNLAETTREREHGV